MDLPLLTKVCVTPPRLGHCLVGVEGGGWLKSVLGQQRDLRGNGPGGVCPGQYGHAEAVCERKQFAEPLPVVGSAMLASFRRSTRAGRAQLTVLALRSTPLDGFAFHAPGSPRGTTTVARQRVG
jgi:hypothetical protein